MHRGVWERLKPFMPGLRSKLLHHIQNSLKAYPDGIPVLASAFTTALPSGQQVPFYIVGHSLGGQLASVATIALVYSPDELPFSGTHSSSRCILCL